ncbi:DUF3606 domain-containing protein [bacterium]|nr:DUF3606 domain-containing protein [bacterium]
MNKDRNETDAFSREWPSPGVDAAVPGNGIASRRHILLREYHEIEYWIRELGVTEKELRLLVTAIGDDEAVVRKWLGRTSWNSSHREQRRW